MHFFIFALCYWVVRGINTVKDVVLCRMAVVAADWVDVGWRLKFLFSDMWRCEREWR